MESWATSPEETGDEGYQSFSKALNGEVPGAIAASHLLTLKE